MKAIDLKVGDVFTISKPDPESPVRICLTAYPQPIRFGFPSKPEFWCFMGELCEVVVRSKKEKHDLIGTL